MFSWQRKLGSYDGLSDEVVQAIDETVACLHPDPEQAHVHYVLQSSPAGKTIVGAVVDAPDGDWWCADDDICGPHRTATEARDCLVERLYGFEEPLWEHKPRKHKRLLALGPRLRVSALAERRG